jgi:hypothetical protein
MVERARAFVPPHFAEGRATVSFSRIQLSIVSTLYIPYPATRRKKLWRARKHQKSAKSAKTRWRPCRRYVISTSVLFTRRCFNDAPRRPPSCRPPEVPWETIVRPRLALPRRLTSRATRSLRRSKEDSPPRRFPKTRRVCHCLCLFAAKQDGFRVVRRVGFSARRGDVAGVEEHRSARGLVFVIARRARWGWPGGPVFSARGLAACLRQPCGARRRACVRHVPAPA